MPAEYNHDHEHEVTIFAETNFRNQKRRFGIKTDDRRRHMYIVGKTGMGKTTLLENLFVSDVLNGHGCCYIDPHGDTTENLIDFIPPARINDVVYFNPADVEYPMGFNILETEAEWQKPLVASGLMGVFKKIWPDVWSPRMEYILMNCVLALLDYPGSTLLGINRLLVDKEFRARIVAKIRDPIVKTFWVAEFTSWSEKYATEAIAPVQNKVGQFLSSSVIRNIVAQVKSTLNIRRMMDDQKILIVNLSKGRIGEDNMRLLGGMLVTKIQLAAQERQNIPEKDRRDFYLFVDEFQNFANESFAVILSEARKYRLNLIVAHQYIEQLDERVVPAIFGNVGTIITMRVGGADAEAMETEFAPVFTPEDLVGLAKTQIYLKLMVDGVATRPFSANTLPPIAKRTGSAENVIKVSRERYAEPRQIIEEKVLKWSGMELAMSLGSAGGSMTPSSLDGEADASLEARSEGPSISPAISNGPVAMQYPAIRTEEEQEQGEKQEKEIDINSAMEDTSGGEYLMIKPERMAAIKANTGASGGGFQKKKEKPKFPHTCSRCKKTWDLPIQLDPSRPMYCPDCLPIIREERKKNGSEIKRVLKNPPPPEGSGFVGATESSGPNRPRVTAEDRFGEVPRGNVKIVSSDSGEKGEEDEMGVLRSNRPSSGLGEGGEKRKRKRRRHKKSGGAPSSSSNGSAQIVAMPPIPDNWAEQMAAQPEPRTLSSDHSQDASSGQVINFDNF